MAAPPVHSSKSTRRGCDSRHAFNAKGRREVVSDLNLKSFCSTQKWRQESVGEPWSAGGFTYATDGHVLVRVPRLADVPERERSPTTEHIAKLFAEAKTEPLGALNHIDPPTKAAPVTCGECGGSGRCKKCDGHGECHYCDTECEECDGSGDCGCDGGRVEDRTIFAIRVGGAIVNAEHTARIAALGDIEIVTCDHEASTTPIYFRFAGGDGLVMPLRESRVEDGRIKVLPLPPHSEPAQRPNKNDQPTGSGER